MSGRLGADVNVTSATGALTSPQGASGTLLGIKAIEAAAREQDASFGRNATASSSGQAPAPAPTSAPLVDGASVVAAQEQGRSVANPLELSPEEQQVVRELQRRDAEVRRHERAHAAAGGPVAGAPVYEFQRGPDGRFYAVNGEVRIDVSPEGNPRATIAKMELVIRAALAPAQPSAQDRTVAAQAKQIIIEAERELKEIEAEEQTAARERRESLTGELDQSAANASGGLAETAAQAYGRIEETTALVPDANALVRQAFSLTA